MEKKKTGLSVVESLDAQVVNVIGSAEIQGFEKAYKVATAIETLQGLLTSEYMAPIMKLQGNRLGFRTDQDQNNGYSEAVVKNCLIEAVLMGVQPVGNQFNIIKGNTYLTKEGFGYLLKKFPGLNYKIVSELPRVNKGGTGAAVTMKISWSIDGGEPVHQDIEIPIKVNNGMGTDGILGKGKRKARAWLHERLTGTEITDGDITDLDRLPAAKIASLSPAELEASETAEEISRALEFIKKQTTTEGLEGARAFCETTGGELLIAFNLKLTTLTDAK